ncbi:MAG: hypothetical protein WAV00_19935 [Nocardioides sp.]
MLPGGVDLLVADTVDGLQGGVQREGDAGERRGRRRDGADGGGGATLQRGPEGGAEDEQAGDHHGHSEELADVDALPVATAGVVGQAGPGAVELPPRPARTSGVRIFVMQLQRPGEVGVS